VRCLRARRRRPQRSQSDSLSIDSGGLSRRRVSLSTSCGEQRGGSLRSEDQHRRVARKSTPWFGSRAGAGSRRPHAPVSGSVLRIAGGSFIGSVFPGAINVGASQRLTSSSRSAWSLRDAGNAQARSCAGRGARRASGTALVASRMKVKRPGVPSFSNRYCLLSTRALRLASSHEVAAQQSQ